MELKLFQKMRKWLKNIRFQLFGSKIELSTAPPESVDSKRQNVRFGSVLCSGRPRAAQGPLGSNFGAVWVPCWSDLGTPNRTQNGLIHKLNERNSHGNHRDGICDMRVVPKAGHVGAEEPKGRGCGFRCPTQPLHEIVDAINGGAQTENPQSDRRLIAPRAGWRGVHKQRRLASRAQKHGAAAHLRHHSAGARAAEPVHTRAVRLRRRRKRRGTVHQCAPVCRRRTPRRRSPRGN